MDGLNSRKETTEKRISKPEDGTVEITHPKQQREKTLGGKMSRASGNCGTRTKKSSIHVLGVNPEGEEKEISLFTFLRPLLTGCCGWHFICLSLFQTLSSRKEQTVVSISAF